MVQTDLKCSICSWHGTKEEVIQYTGFMRTSRNRWKSSTRKCPRCNGLVQGEKEIK